MSADMERPEMIPAVVKWGKRRLTGLAVCPGASADILREQICSMTGVPTIRQKLMCAGAWKGILKERLPSDLVLPAGQSELTILLLGSAEATLIPPPEPIIFVEDMPEGDVAESDAAEEAKLLEAAESDIVVAQKLPGQRNDGEAEGCKYNSLVTGMSQMQIERTLRSRRERGDCLLVDCCAMQMGLELVGRLIRMKHFHLFWLCLCMRSPKVTRCECE